MATPARVERGNLPLIQCTDREAIELIGCATAHGRPFSEWAKDTLQAAARRSAPVVLVELSEDERKRAQSVAERLNLTLSAFARRATIAAIRRLGSTG